MNLYSQYIGLLVVMNYVFVISLNKLYYYYIDIVNKYIYCHRFFLPFCQNSFGVRLIDDCVKKNHFSINFYFLFRFKTDYTLSTL